MSFLTVTPEEIMQFLRILLWIAVPLIIISLVTVSLMHYYRKRKLMQATAFADEPGLNEEQVTYYLQSADGTAGSSYANLIRENQHQEELREDRYQILKHQFRSLYSKYVELLAKAGDHKKSAEENVEDEHQKKLEEYESKIRTLQDALITLKNNAMEQNGEVNWQESLAHKESEVQLLNGMIRQLREDISIEREQNSALAAELLQLQEHLNRLETSAHESEDDAGKWNLSLQQQLYEAGKKYDTEKNEWMKQLQDSYRDLQALKEENLALRSKVDSNQAILSGGGMGYTEAVDKINVLQADIAHIQDEKSQLKDQLLELEYLRDVVDEKKLQVDFLQNQLEQRIRNFHQLEHQQREDSSQMSILKATVYSYEQQVKGLERDADELQKQLTGLDITMHGLNEENQKIRESLEEKSMYAEQLERKNQEWQEQHLHRLELLNEKENSIASLNNELRAHAEKISRMEEELNRRNTILSSLYSELHKAFHPGEPLKDSPSLPIPMGNKLEPQSKSDDELISGFRLSVVG
ncbi:MAG: hypothetical protein C5B52_03435 [Bacteroidetes bacterium]|nr:MAG: hypothetical protein C5B52_03435 [Bacteroidota bacterium]